MQQIWKQNSRWKNTEQKSNIPLLIGDINFVLEQTELNIKKSWVVFPWIVAFIKSMLMPTLKSESKIKLKVYLTISNILVEYGVFISQIFVVSRRNIITNVVIILTLSISFVLTLFSMLFLLKWNVLVLQYE